MHPGIRAAQEHDVSEQTNPAVQGRPKRSSVERLAAQWLAQRLVERIPEYATYVAYEGLTVLADHVYTAMLGFRPGMDVATVGRRLEEATMAGAPDRVAALIPEFPKLRIDAEVLLDGGWIRETALPPPFEGDFARVGIYRGRLDGSQNDALPKVGYAFRHPSLDARGMVMFVETRRGQRTDLDRGQLVPWERIEGVERVQNADLPLVAARHRTMLAMIERAQAVEAALPETIERAFAEAHFKEAVPDDRRAFLVSLSDELAQAGSAGDESAIRSVLNRLSGVSAAANRIEGFFQSADYSPEGPGHDGPRP